MLQTVHKINLLKKKYYDRKYNYFSLILESNMTWTFLNFVKFTIHNVQQKNELTLRTHYCETNCSVYIQCISYTFWIQKVKRWKTMACHKKYFILTGNTELWAHFIAMWVISVGLLLMVLLVLQNTTAFI